MSYISILKPMPKASDALSMTKQLRLPPEARDLRRKSWPAISTSKPLRIVDLFCGCGGLTLGAVQAAISLERRPEIALALDLAPSTVKVYESNFSKFSANILAADITQFVSGKSFARLNEAGVSLTSSLGQIDVLLAGPPCQGNSDLNNSSRRTDARNELYLAPTLFAKSLAPKILIIENVPAVVHGHSNVVDRSVDSLKKSGYACIELRIELTSLGLPQTRKRHLLIASTLHSQKDLEAIFSSSPMIPRNVALWPFIKDLEDETEEASSIFCSASRASALNATRIDYMFETGVFDLPNRLRPACHRDKEHSYISMYGRLRRDIPAQTITSGFGSMGQGRFVHPTRRRTITPHEAARIQGFPDYFSFDEVKSVTELRQMIGNAVAPALSSEILKRLLKK